MIICDETGIVDMILMSLSITGGRFSTRELFKSLVSTYISQLHNFRQFSYTREDFA